MTPFVFSDSCPCSTHWQRTPPATYVYESEEDTLVTAGEYTLKAEGVSLLCYLDPPVGDTVFETVTLEQHQVCMVTLREAAGYYL